MIVLLLCTLDQNLMLVNQLIYFALHIFNYRVKLELEVKQAFLNVFILLFSSYVISFVIIKQSKILYLMNKRLEIISQG